MNEKPTVLESHPVFRGKIFGVRTDIVAFAGRRHQLDIVEHGGSIAILATPTPGRVLLVRQYRHAARAELWEIPAGVAEPGEDPREGALRELREETGYAAGSMERIVSAFPTPGFCDERLHLFHATQLQPGAQSLDEDEAIEVREFGLDEALGMQASGAVADLKTFASLLWLAGTQPGGR